MYKIISFVSITSLFLLFQSCHNEENISKSTGRVSFSLLKAKRDFSKEATATPAYVLISITDVRGKAREDIKLSLFVFGQSYFTENIELQTGVYHLTQFVVMDSSNKVIYATPLEGSELAKYVTDPLPMEFTITETENNLIVPQVLSVLEEDKPELFGYASFGFEVVSNNSVVLVKTSVKITIGSVMYENLDANIRIKGHDQNNNVQWSKDYFFTGPMDILEIKNGFHHYTLELINKWSVRDTLSDISLKNIWDGRADGPLPVTYILTGSKNAKKLSLHTTSREENVPGIGIIYRPESRVSYTYSNDGRLEIIHYEYFNTETSKFEEMNTETFTYEGNTVSKVLKTLNGKPYSESKYEYGAQNKITVTNFFSEFVETQVETNHNSDDPNNYNVHINYSYSTGASLLYQFRFYFKNILNDKTSTPDELCNEGEYTYDKYINPFRHLGYMDINNQNRSINNKLTENIDYISCSFPANRVPESFNYIYDQDGYPIKKITTYKRTNPSDYQYHSEETFLYE